MEVVAALPDSRVEGYLAAGHAATVTVAYLELFVARFGRPVVIAGFEPLDILAALVVLVEQIAGGERRLVNAFPRCVTAAGNRRAMALLWRVFTMGDGHWRGIARVPEGNLSLRPEYARHDAQVAFGTRLTLDARGVAPELLALRADGAACRCGAIMSGQRAPRRLHAVRDRLPARAPGRRVYGEHLRGLLIPALSTASRRRGGAHDGARHDDSARPRRGRPRHAGAHQNLFVDPESPELARLGDGAVVRVGELDLVDDDPTRTS